MGATAAVAGAAAVLVPGGEAAAWAKPAIRAAIGVPALAGSDENWRDLGLEIVAGERLSETTRQLTLELRYLDDSSLAVGAGVYGDSQTLPGPLVATWHSTLEPDAPQYSYTGADGRVTLYLQTDPSSTEVRNMFLSASVEDGTAIRALGNRAWSGSTLPAWANGPWPA